MLPGAADGSRVRVAGHGAPSPTGGPAGDLVLTIHVTPHAQYRREGDDLHLDLPITVAEAFRGAKVKVPTVDGSVALKVPERTQSGATVRLRVQGRRSAASKSSGDLYVGASSSRSPTVDTPELGDLIDRIAKLQPEDPRASIRL